MKILRSLLLPLLIISLLLFSGCSDSNNTETTRLSSENAALNRSLELVTKEKEEFQKTAEEYKEELVLLKKEYSEYKQKMAKYEGLADDELELLTLQIEADKAAAEAEAAERKAAEEAKAKEEEEAARIAKEEAEAAKAAEEAKGYETGITYSQIARNPDEYMGQKVKFRGTVIQLMEGTFFNQLRFAVNDDYNQIIYLEYDPSHLSERVLEDDTLTIYGVSMGTITYESTMGASITIPAVDVDKIEIHY